MATDVLPNQGHDGEAPEQILTVIEAKARFVAITGEGRDDLEEIAKMTDEEVSFPTQANYGANFASSQASGSMETTRDGADYQESRHPGSSYESGNASSDAAASMLSLGHG
eukprot:252663-Amphidinium_carterae.4